MNRRDFVKLFAKVPVAAGAATFLGNTKAAEPVIDILIPEKELIIPEQKDTLGNILLIDKVTSVDFFQDNNITLQPILGKFDDFDIGKGQVRSHIFLEAIFYEDLVNNLLSNKYEYFKLNVPWDEKAELRNFNNLKFVISDFGIASEVANLTTVNLNGILMENQNIQFYKG